MTVPDIITPVFTTAVEAAVMVVLLGPRPIQYIMLNLNIIKGELRLFGGNNVSKMISN